MSGWLFSHPQPYRAFEGPSRCTPSINSSKTAPSSPATPAPASLHPPARPGLGGEVMRAHRGAGQGRAQGEGGHGLIRGSLITWRSAGAWLGVSTPLRHRRLAALPCPSFLLKSPSEIRRLVLSSGCVTMHERARSRIGCFWYFGSSQSSGFSLGNLSYLRFYRVWFVLGVREPY